MTLRPVRRRQTRWTHYENLVCYLFWIADRPVPEWLRLLPGRTRPSVTAHVLNTMRLAPMQRRPKFTFRKASAVATDPAPPPTRETGFDFVLAPQMPAPRPPSRLLYVLHIQLKEPPARTAKSNTLYMLFLDTYIDGFGLQR